MQTKPGDVLLIFHRDQPSGYGRVEEIIADAKRGWWQIRLTLLQLPPAKVTWILREEYIDGQEFTMGGEALRLERLAPVAAPPSGDPPPEKGGSEESSKVVSLADRLKKRDQ